MRLIAHRGNLNGPSESENKPHQIYKSLELGYDVEIDVWKFKELFYLGHNGPDLPINPNLLELPNLWCHAKNFEALDYLLEKKIHCFWHEEDSYTITSRGYIWTHVIFKNMYMHSARSVYLDFDIPRMIPNCYAICSDYVQVFDMRYNDWSQP